MSVCARLLLTGLMGLLVSLAAEASTADAGTTELAPGESVRLTAATKDQFGHDMEVADLIGWVATGGSLDRSSGSVVVYTAGRLPGEYVVVANRAGLTAKRRIRIVAAAEQSPPVEVEVQADLR